MTELSPAAQATVDAWVAARQNQTRTSGRYEALAAALRAVASSRLVQVFQDEINCDIAYILTEDILAIAAELEGTHD